MDEAIFTDINDRAEEFCATSRLVAESSKLRKAHSEEAIQMIRQSLEIGDILNHEFEIISRTNKTTRDQDTMVQNCCFILDLNCAHQNEIIKTLKKNGAIEPGALARMDELVGNLAESIHKAVILLHMIIQNDNDIILMDNLIMNRKKFQRDSIDHLKKLALQTLDDADSAIRGSSSNLKRGLRLVDHLADVKRYIKEKKRDEMTKLIDEANTQWNIAAAVNSSSITQMVFAEQVNRFTVRLHEDSNAIRDLVIDKHRIFLKNLELTTELTVILSLEIKEYLPAREVIESVKDNPGLPNDIRRQIHNLISYVTIACKDIHFVSNMNFDMTESIDLNADIEKKSMDLTKLELEYFDRIREEVASMTEATKYPIEGSAQNMENGKLLEKNLRAISKALA